jgi:hypothetical protein
MSNINEHRFAMAEAVSVAAKTFNAHCYKAMRNPAYAADFGVREWPEQLTPENVVSWIVANVSYSTPCEAHTILKAMVFENNA